MIYIVNFLFRPRFTATFLPQLTMTGISPRLNLSSVSCLVAAGVLLVINSASTPLERKWLQSATVCAMSTAKTSVDFRSLAANCCQLWNITSFRKLVFTAVASCDVEKSSFRMLTLLKSTLVPIVVTLTGHSLGVSLWLDGWIIADYLFTCHFSSIICKRSLW